VYQNERVERHASSTQILETTFADLQFCYYIEYYSNRRRCRVSRLLSGNKKTAARFDVVHREWTIFSRQELSNVCKVFLSSTKTRGSGANGYYASVFTFPGAMYRAMRHKTRDCNRLAGGNSIYTYICIHIYIHEYLYIHVCMYAYMFSKC